LKACAFVAITAFPLNGCSLPLDLFLDLTRSADPRAEWPVAAGCLDESRATTLLDLWIADTPAATEATAKALAASIRHSPLRAKCRLVLEKLTFPTNLADLKTRLDSLAS
jgi:hypothetical protein